MERGLDPMMWASWKFVILRPFAVAESIRFKVLAQTVPNIKEITVRKFLERLSKEKYLKKKKLRGESVYSKTPKFQELVGAHN